MTEQEQTKLLKQFEDLQKEFNLLELKFNELSNQTEISGDGTNTVAISNLQSQINALSANINSLNSLLNFADTQNLQTISTNINEIESGMTEIESGMTEIQNNITEIESDMTEIQSDINGFENSITEIQSDVDAFSTRLDTFNTLLNAKQGRLFAGEGITILNNTISADISGKQDKLVAGANVYFVQDTISVDLSSKQDVLTAGNGIDITDNVISATNSDGSSSLTAGDNITIENGIISADLSSKQDILTAGNGITIENNVISSTGGSSGGDSGDTTEIKADISELQSKFNSFLSIIKDRNAEYNTPYNQISQDEVVQTYDCMDRNYEYTGTAQFSTPCFYFYAKNFTINANLRITIKFKGITSGSGTIFLHFNDSTVTDSQIFNFTDEYEYYTFDFPISSQTLGNYFFIAVKPSSLISYSLAYIKAEVIGCTNPIFLNKMSPFSVDYFNDYYYIHDCTGATAKRCIVHKNDIATIDNLTWTDTGISALKMIATANLVGPSSNYTADIVSYCYLGKDGIPVFFNNQSNSNVIMTGYKTSYISPVNPYNVPGICLFDNYSSSNIKTVKITFNTSGSKSTSTLTSDSSRYFCLGIQNFLFPIAKLTNGNCIYVTNTGEAILNFDGKTLSLGFCTPISAYYSSQSPLILNVYVKIYDKIVKYVASFDNSSNPQKSTGEIIGYYDFYFEGANNDYFVVKNNKLFYYKKSLQELE